MNAEVDEKDPLLSFAMGPHAYTVLDPENQAIPLVCKAFSS